MLNQIVLVGRIKEFIKINNDCQIKIAVSRCFKNEDGIYDTDLITVYAKNTISENIMKYCTEDDVIGIKGRVESDGEAINIIADRVTFLSSKKSEEEKIDNEVA